MLKYEAKSERELTCLFKIDMRIWKMLIWSLKSLRDWYFNELFLTKVNNV